MIKPILDKPIKSIWETKTYCLPDNHDLSEINDLLNQIGLGPNEHDCDNERYKI